jgi:N-acetyl-gamma-glutamyl-phosphate reductase
MKIQRGNFMGIKRKKVTIVGATGYGGLGLIEILLRHPSIEIVQLTAKKEVNVPISKIFPHLKGLFDMEVQDYESIDPQISDLAFFSTPDRVGMELIHDFHKYGVPVIDFSGDFRFRDIKDWREYAKRKGQKDEHLAEGLLNLTVYGLPEMNRHLIKNADIIGNPGCFAVSMILGLMPAISRRVIKGEGIVCDGKTGVSGAGKNPGSENFYPNRYENVNTYREGVHQHPIEVEKSLSQFGERVKVSFIPNLVPLCRGILTTIYADLSVEISQEEITHLYEDFYRNEPFVRINREGRVSTMNVRGSNICEIFARVDRENQKLLVVSAIDNLIKGQAGNAVQNANLRLGLEETAGLFFPGPYP